MAESTDRTTTCGICEEVYNELNRKPLLLPCTHSFCKSCLQQMQTNNGKRCPVCRNNWTGHSIDSLIYVRQLVPAADTPVPSRRGKTVSIPTKVCGIHRLDIEILCNSCKTEVCKRCLQEKHKQCDWMLTEQKIEQLNEILQNSVTSTRIGLIKFFSRKSGNNRVNLLKVKDLIKELQEWEKRFTSLETTIATEQEAAMSRLEDLQNQPAGASVADYTTAIANAKSLIYIDDFIQCPKVMDFFLYKSEYSMEERTSDVSVKRCWVVLYFLMKTLILFTFTLIFYLIYQTSRGIEMAGEGENITWTVTGSSGLSSATRRLQTEQPKTLVVDIPRDVPTPPALQQFCQVVQKKFTGNLKLRLWRSYLKYEKCDKNFPALSDFRYFSLFQVELMNFQSCVKFN